MAGMFNGAKRDQRRSGHGFTDINVTPLVDVMLVLLVVFMISAPMLTVGVPLDLPKTKAAQLNDQIDPIVISVDADGRSFLQETELSGDVLIERLKVVTQSNPEAKIYVRGDAKLAYGRIMEVMGEISASGFTKVSLLAEMPTGPKTQPVVGPKARPAVLKAVSGAPSGAAVPTASTPQGLPTLQTLMQSSQAKGGAVAPVRPVAAPVHTAPAQAARSAPVVKPSVKPTPTAAHSTASRSQPQVGQPQTTRGANAQRPQSAAQGNRASNGRPAQG